MLHKVTVDYESIHKAIKKELKWDIKYNEDPFSWPSHADQQSKRVELVKALYRTLEHYCTSQEYKAFVAKRKKKNKE